MTSALLRSHLARSLQRRAELRLRLLEFDMENLVRAAEMAASSLRRGGKLLFLGMAAAPPMRSTSRRNSCAAFNARASHWRRCPW